MYVAIQQGVYRHKIVAVTSYEADAVRASIEFLKNEKDDYHTVDIVLFRDGQEISVCEIIRKDVHPRPYGRPLSTEISVLKEGAKEPYFTEEIFFP